MSGHTWGLPRHRGEMHRVRTRQGSRVAAVGAVAGAAVYLLAGFAGWAQAAAAFLAWFSVAVHAAVLVALFARARLGEPVRWSWHLIGAAFAVGIVGTASYQVFAPADPNAGWLTLRDAGRALFVAFAYAGLVLGLHGWVRHWNVGMLIERAVLTLAVIAVAFQVLFPNLLVSVDISVPAAVVLLLYQIGDLLLLGTMLAGLAMLGRRADRQWFLLMGAVSALVVSNVIHTRLGGATFAEWVASGSLLLGAALVACAATSSYPARSSTVSRTERHRGRQAGSSRAALALPAVATAISLMLLIPVGDWQAAREVQWLAASALLLSAVRTFLALREVRLLAQARLEASKDPLTRLANRRGLGAATEAWFADPVAVKPAALVLCNLDEFKEVNAELGEDAGDAVLIGVAARLEQVGARAGVVARLAGDEFAIFVHGDQALAEQVASDISAMMRTPVIANDVAVPVSVSIGISLAPRDGATFSALLRTADIALYQAKASDRGYLLFDPINGQDARDVQRLREFREALSNDELVLHYQPKTGLDDGAVIGAEALVRWEHPELGLQYPDTFLPMVDRAGLMPALTEVVLGQALRQAMRWHRRGHALSVAVNLPSAAIDDAELPGRVYGLLQHHGLPASCLTLEITEESLMGDRTRARAVLAALRGKGISISIDDYGTGYSSLAYLRELPVDELKLDRSFIWPMSYDDRAAKIVESTIQLAHSLGLAIVAEGVEDERAARQLCAYGCDAAQGYHYSKPVAAEEFIGWLERRAQESPASASQAALVPRPRGDRPRV